jgi:acetylornithine deacetylase/succinyl-diaminopimelate desuccinylase-like protein
MNAFIHRPDDDFHRRPGDSRQHRQQQRQHCRHCRRGAIAKPAVGGDRFLYPFERSLGIGVCPACRPATGLVAQPFDVMFLGHMDTVFPTGEVQKRPFATDRNRATGPGVCDMKGGLLVALHILEALHHEGLLNRLSIGVCFNGDEEVGSGSSRPWIEAHARNSRRVFVFEPCRPGNRFVLQRKGGGGYTDHGQGNVGSCRGGA